MSWYTPPPASGQPDPPPPAGQPGPSVVPPGSYRASDGNVYPQQQGYRPQGGPPIPPQKSGSKKVLFIILGVVGGLCFLGIISAALGANKTADELKALGTTSSSVEGTVRTIAPGAPASTTPRATSAPAKYVQVATLSGTGSKRGQGFALSGKARMNYKYTPSADSGNFGLFAPYLVKEGESLQDKGGIPETTCLAACSDTTQLPQKGNYYLDINSSSGNWTIVIEDVR